MTISEKTSHAGLVLAAGASARMGQPKALLRCPDGSPLGERQATKLAAAGCARAALVAGADARAIAAALTDAHVVENDRWKLGRVSSVQAGLRALPGFDGYLILPVDTVGVRIETLSKLIEVADAARPRALRPVHQGRPGYVTWISRDAAQALLGIDPSPDMNLHAWLAGFSMTVEVDDPAILNNVNTPEEWERVKSGA